jgi:hypothetical protein
LHDYFGTTNLLIIKQFDMKKMFTSMSHAGCIAFALISLFSSGSVLGQNSRNIGPVVVNPTHSSCPRANLLFNDRITTSEATVSWNPALAADSFKVVYTALTAGMTNTVTVNGFYHYVPLQGLLPAEQYKWYVISFCNGTGTTSDFMKFSTLAPRYSGGVYTSRNITINPICPSIGTVTNVDVTHEMALIAWTQTANFDSIRIRFTPFGTTNYKTITISGTPNPGRYFLSGLNSQSSYDVSVSTYCATGSSSPWSHPVTVTTLMDPGPRFMNTAKNVNISPNPSEGKSSIIFYTQSKGIVNVAMYDLTGKEVLSTSILAEVGRNQYPMDLTEMHKGIYLVKISGNELNSVQRMIIQ